jgi:LmbE family N-acetylglucosaminyl deacetylase
MKNQKPIYFHFVKYSLLFIALIFSYEITFSQEVPLQIIVIGAHPDDCDNCAGGTAIQWAAMGHNVKFVSLTNGDAGHYNQGGGALAKRRRAESQEAGRRFGIVEYEVLDNHDGELEPTLNVRLQVIRAIREWNADLVIVSRPNDYHPDHRNAGLVVQDAAYMVIVPNVAPDTPPLTKNPVFLYCQDRFQKPNPFSPDIAVSIDQVFTQKINAMAAHVSQFFEWLPWTMGRLEEVPEGSIERKEWLADWRKRPITKEIRSSLNNWYGPSIGNAVKTAEVFEICEYGRQPDEKTIRQFFPMIGKKVIESNYIIEASPSEKSLKIDGKLDDPVYRIAKKYPLKNSMTKGEVIENGYQTYVQLAYDKNYLYVGFHCEDKDIFSSFTQRDEYLWQEEAVEVFVDTDSESHNYVEIEVSPNNVLFDSYIVDPFNIDVPATIPFNLKDIKTAVHVIGTTNNRQDEDEIWSVELAIPMDEIKSGFDIKNVSTYEWKINFYRINRDDHGPQYMAWSPTQGSFHQPLKFGKIVFKM